MAQPRLQVIKQVKRNFLVGRSLLVGSGVSGLSDEKQMGAQRR